MRAKVLTRGELRASERRAEKRILAKAYIRPLAEPLLRVGVDIDNTMINNDPVWRSFLQEMSDNGLCTHRRPDDAEVQTYWDYWENEVCAACFRRCTTHESIIRSHRLRPDVERVLGRLTLAGIEFTIITGRPLQTRDATMLWLREKALCPPRIFRAVRYDSEKAQLALDLGLDVMLDDSPPVIRRVASTGKVGTVLMAATHNVGSRELCKPDFIANSWRDVENYLVGLLAVKVALPNYDALDKAILQEQGVVF